jgi:membrane protein
VSERPNVFSRAKSAATERWRRLRGRRAWARHLAEAWARLQDNNGSQYAAAITYFSFLALFPLVLLAIAITGFVLHSHPAAQQTLFDHITEQVPGSFGTTLKDSITTAIKQRTGVGIVGLVGVLLTGLGWIGNLRAAVDAVWGRRPDKRNFFVAKAMNLLVLGGLGLGILISIGLTVVGTSLTDQILRALSMDHLAGVHYLVKVLGLLLAVVGDVIIFSWLLVRLPGVPVPGRVVVKGALFAAVGFEVLKIVGTFTIAHTANSPTAGPFAGLLAVLIWIQLVARFMLFCAAWMAVLTDERAVAPEVVHEPAGEPEASPAPAAMNPAALAVTLVGTGAVAGAAAATVLAAAVAARRSQGETAHRR